MGSAIRLEPATNRAGLAGMTRPKADISFRGERTSECGTIHGLAMPIDVFVRSPGIPR
jgi:hypothetical protein